LYTDTIEALVDAGTHKVSAIRQNLLGFLVGAAMAGAYVGFGDILMFSVTAHTDAAWIRLLSGAVFSAALTIVIFAGSELFTGTTMYMPMAVLSRRATMAELLMVWIVTWLGNLAGAVILALLLHAASGGVISGDGHDHFVSTVNAKLSASGMELFFRGVLCNWLVCLAIWMCNRTNDATAKFFLIFWPITIFVSAGFEHSVANMFVFALALTIEPSTFNPIAVLHNLFWVTAGNIIGGSVFVAWGYWLQEKGIGHEAHTRLPDEVTPKQSR
jgi:nitrite transporter